VLRPAISVGGGRSRRNSNKFELDGNPIRWRFLQSQKFMTVINGRQKTGGLLFWSRPNVDRKRRHFRQYVTNED
jgi:hypothetical protein